MSDYEHHRGVLQEVPTPDGIEEAAKRILTEQGYDFEPEYIMDDFYDRFYKEYAEVGGKLYKVIKREKCDPYADIFNASVNPDGTINFEVRYYNGGCGFSEAVEHAVERMVQCD